MALGEPPVTSEVAAAYGLVDLVSVDPELELNKALWRIGKADPAALAWVRRLAAVNWPLDEALNAFADLWRDSAAQRIARYVDGDTPWNFEQKQE